MIEAKKSFVDWWRSGTLGGEGYKDAIETLREVTKGLPNKPMTLFFQTYRFGFSFFYGKFEDENRFLPIEYSDGVLLKYQRLHKEPTSCPIFDPQTKEYFVPEVELKYLDPPSGSMPTDQHLDIMIRHRCFNNDYDKILQVLTPYAKQLKNYAESTFYDLARSYPGFIEAAGS